MTTPPLTDQQLADIEARHQAATPGTWWNDGHEIYTGEPDTPAASTWIGETCNIDLPDHGDANGTFIAHAHADVPDLVAEVIRLRVAAVQREALLEAAHCRLHLIQARVEQTILTDGSAGLALDLIPWLDGPLHPTDLADYRTAQPSGT